MGRWPRPHFGNGLHTPQLAFDSSIEQIFTIVAYSFLYPTNVHIDLRHCYISVYRHHDIAHFGENKIRGVTSGEGLGGLVINFRFQIIDGFIGRN